MNKMITLIFALCLIGVNTVIAVDTKEQKNNSNDDFRVESGSKINSSNTNSSLTDKIYGSIELTALSNINNSKNAYDNQKYYLYNEDNKQYEYQQEGGDKVDYYKSKHLNINFGIKDQIGGFRYNINTRYYNYVRNVSFTFTSYTAAETSHYIKEDQKQDKLKFIELYAGYGTGNFDISAGLEKSFLSMDNNVSFFELYTAPLDFTGTYIEETKDNLILAIPSIHFRYFPKDNMELSLGILKSNFYDDTIKDELESLENSSNKILTSKVIIPKESDSNISLSLDLYFDNSHMKTFYFKGFNINKLLFNYVNIDEVVQNLNDSKNTNLIVEYVIPEIQLLGFQYEFSNSETKNDSIKHRFDFGYFNDYSNLDFPYSHTPINDKYTQAYFKRLIERKEAYIEFNNLLLGYNLTADLNQKKHIHNFSLSFIDRTVKNSEDEEILKLFKEYIDTYHRIRDNEGYFDLFFLINYNYKFNIDKRNGLYFQISSIVEGAASTRSVLFAYLFEYNDFSLSVFNGQGQGLRGHLLKRYYQNAIKSTTNTGYLSENLVDSYLGVGLKYSF